MKRERGYEGKSIISATNAEIGKVMIDGAEREILTTYVLLQKASHFRKTSVARNLASKQAKQLKDLVEGILISAGWEVHIKNHLQRESTPCYIHDALTDLAVHEVPFCSETNIILQKQELFDKLGKVRKKEETLRLLKEKIGEKEIDILSLDDEIRLPVVAILKEEGLTLLHEVGLRKLRSGNKGFQWYWSEEEMKEEAREFLEEGEEWKSAVDADLTTAGLEDWIEEVIICDGSASVLPTYDGSLREATLPSGETLYYVRIN